MGKVVIRNVAEADRVDFPRLAGLDAQGAVSSQAVVVGEDRPLHLWAHTLDEDATIQLDAPPVDHLLYVWEGAVAADGEVMPEQSVVAVEHLGSSSVKAIRPGTRLLHFYRPGGDPESGRKAGGHVHRAGPSGIFSGRNATGIDGLLWLDSSCPTCSMWMQWLQFSQTKPVGGFHAHSEDEIIFVIRKGMQVGRQQLESGTALAIDANTRYGFGVAEEGMAFLNFRSSAPYYIGYTEGLIKKPPEDERATWHKFFKPVDATV